MTNPTTHPMELLRRRLAAGEITPSEFDEVATRLSSHSDKGERTATAAAGGGGDDAADELLIRIREKYVTLVLGAIVVLSLIAAPLTFTVVGMVFVVVWDKLGGFDVTDPMALLGRQVMFGLFVIITTAVIATRLVLAGAKMAAVWRMHAYLRKVHPDDLSQRLADLRAAQAERTRANADEPFAVAFTSGGWLLKGLEFDKPERQGLDAVPGPLLGKAATLLTAVLVLGFGLVALRAFG